MIAENLDIVILTVIVVLLFLVFILASIKEINEDLKKPFQGGKERGPRADMMEFVGKLFSSEKLEPVEKEQLLKILNKTITDTELADKNNTDPAK